MVPYMSIVGLLFQHMASRPPAWFIQAHSVLLLSLIVNEKEGCAAKMRHAMWFLFVSIRGHLGSSGLLVSW